MPRKIVCVTGANGFLGAHVVRLLLEKSIYVHAVVRNLTDDRVGFLSRLPQASRFLTIFSARLDYAATLKAALKGCDGLFHVASPVLFDDVESAERTLVEDVVTTAEAAAQACIDTPGVTRLVFTSSISTVVDWNANEDHVFTEKNWSEPDWSRKFENWYNLGKTLAERAAWDIIRSGKEVERAVDMVSLLPTLIIGPALGPSLGFSNGIFKDLLYGEYPTLANDWVDVRDVAEAHVAAMFDPTAKNRYILNAPVLPWAQFVAVVRECGTELGIQFDVPDTPVHAPTPIDGQRYKGLGISFRNVADSIRDTIRDMKERGELPTHKTA